MVTEPPDPTAAIRKELHRIEEDCTHSAKSHFNAGDRWARLNYWIGIPSVGLSTLAGTAFFSDFPAVAGVMAAVVSVLAALMTFLKPAERAAIHKSAGDQYLALRNDTRVFREIQLSYACDQQAAIDGLNGFAKRRNELNQASPQFAAGDRRRARKGIEEGEATHAIDRGNS